MTPRSVLHPDISPAPESARAAPLVLVSDEQALVARVRAGDHAAFERLFLAYYPPLWRFAYGYVGTHAVAEELVQDVLCEVWARRAGWIVTGSVKSYLYAAVRNRALNQMRRGRSEARWEAVAVERGDVLGMGESALPVSDRVEQDDRRRAIRAAIDVLPDRRRLVLTLRWEHGLSYTEIATVAGISVKAAEMAVARALPTLRAALAHFD